MIERVVLLAVLVVLAWGCMWQAGRINADQGSLNVEFLWWFASAVCTGVAIGAVWLWWGW